MGAWPSRYERDDTLLYALVVFDGCLGWLGDRFEAGRRRYVWPAISAARQVRAPAYVQERISRKELSEALRAMRRELDTEKNARTSRTLGGWLGVQFIRLAPEEVVAVFEIPMVKPYRGRHGYGYHSYTRFSLDDLDLFRKTLRDDVGRVLEEWNGLGLCTGSFKVKMSDGG